MKSWEDLIRLEPRLNGLIVPIQQAHRELIRGGDFSRNGFWKTKIEPTLKTLVGTNASVEELRSEVAEKIATEALQSLLPEDQSN